MASFLHRHHAKPRSPIPAQYWTRRPTRLVRQACLSAIRRHSSLVQQGSAAALRGESGLSTCGRCCPVRQTAAKDATAPSRSVCRGGGRAPASSACNARGLLAARCSCESTACLEPEAVLPNPSVNLTRYGRRCKPGLSQRYHRLSPGLQHLPTRAGYLER